MISDNATFKQFGHQSKLCLDQVKNWFTIISSSALYMDDRLLH